MSPSILWLIAGAALLALEAFGIPGVGLLFIGLGQSTSQSPLKLLPRDLAVFVGIKELDERLDFKARYLVIICLFQQILYFLRI